MWTSISELCLVALELPQLLDAQRRLPGRNAAKIVLGRTNIDSPEAQHHLVSKPVFCYRQEVWHGIFNVGTLQPGAEGQRGGQRPDVNAA